MSGTTETLFTLLVLAGILATTTSIVAPRSSVGALVRQYRLPLAALIGLGATAGSLYFSEARNFTPCDLCWYQRIAMYPLGVLLAMAVVRKDRSIVPYGLVLAVIGGGISIYHYQLQLFPDQGSTCDFSAPCTFQWVDVFGFVSIPLLALGCFISITGLLWPLPSESRQSSTSEKEHLHA